MWVSQIPQYLFFQTVPCEGSQPVEELGTELFLGLFGEDEGDVRSPAYSP